MTGAGFGLAGRRVAVLGVADEASIAWAIARAFQAQGARVTIGYQQRFFSRVRLLLRDNPEITGERCDVMVDDEVRNFFARFAGDPVDTLVHAVAFGPPEIFSQPVSAVSRAAFAETLTISAHSLGSVVHHANAVLTDGGNVQTLSFQAAERAVPMYGTMGVAKAALESMVRYLAIELGPRRIRVNAISPGPIETLAAISIIRAVAASGRTDGSALARALDEAQRDPGVSPGDEVASASSAWKRFEQATTHRCAIPDTITQDDVAGCSLFLASDYARKITGQVIRVDCGLSSSLFL
jgi:enoyl-[acyl-carrier protein] reductase I